MHHANEFFLQHCEALSSNVLMLRFSFAYAWLNLCSFIHRCKRTDQVVMLFGCDSIHSYRHGVVDAAAAFTPSHVCCQKELKLICTNINEMDGRRCLQFYFKHLFTADKTKAIPIRIVDEISFQNFV